jgi:hypothetical protein
MSIKTSFTKLTIIIFFTKDVFILPTINYLAFARTFHFHVTFFQGCAVAQMVSCRLPTAAARVLARINSYGICGGQNGTGAGLLRVLQFPLPSIPPTAPQS